MRKHLPRTRLDLATQKLGDFGAGRGREIQRERIHDLLLLRHRKTGDGDIDDEI